MRILTTAVRNAIAAKSPSFFLVRIGTTYKSTTHTSQIVVGGNTYVSDGLVLKIDPIRLTSTVDREQFSIIIVDPTFAMAGIIEPGTNPLTSTGSLTGISLGIDLGFIDISTGVPSVTSADYITIYSGTIDTWAYASDVANRGSVGFKITGTSPMNNLDQKQFIEISKQAIRAKNPADSCADNIYDGSLALTLRWGKE